MAEIIINIQETRMYDQDDVLCAFNDRKIHQVHAEHTGHRGTMPEPVKDKAEAFCNENHDLVFLRGPFNKICFRLPKINKKIKQIHKSTDLGPKEKKERVGQLNQAK